MSASRSYEELVAENVQLRLLVAELQDAVARQERVNQAPAQYGSRVRAPGVYMLSVQHLPLKRTAEFTSEVVVGTGQVSPGQLTGGCGHRIGWLRWSPGPGG